MISAAIFFHDNHGVITPPSLIEQHDFLSVETVSRAGEAEGSSQKDRDVSQSNKHIHTSVYKPKPLMLNHWVQL